MTTQRRIGILMLLLAVTFVAVLTWCCIRILHIDTTTVIHIDRSQSTRSDITLNWFVVVPLALWALAAVGLLILPHRLVSSYWEKLPKPRPQNVRRILGVVLGVVTATLMVLWWNYEPHPGQYNPSLLSTSLQSDIRLMWKTQRLSGNVEGAGTSTPHASTDAAINAASRVFNTVKLVGLTKAEVIAAIGSPKTSNDSIYNFPFYPTPKGAMVFRFDSGAYGWQFTLLFDAEGKVQKVERQWID